MERPYLSIGEVLELVKYEFPDVSISRIRTLESGGHLDLERTASGYRKFYDADVAYLKTLLRGGIGADNSDVQTAGRANEPLSAPEPLTALPTKRATNEAVRSAFKQLSHETTQTSTDMYPEDSGTDFPVPVLGPDGELPGNPERRHPAALAAQRRANASAFGSTSGPSAVPPGHLPAPQAPPSQSVQSVQSVHPEPPVLVSAVIPAIVHEVPIPEVMVPEAMVPEVPVPEVLEVAPAESFPQNPLTANPTGTNLSLDELSKATGVSIETIRDLESLGLLRGQGVFSTVYYDEDSLLTCRLVAAFQTYGVEPRHLRMYKLAADREAAFFEQVVTPQLRRRNPDAREKAIETLGELVRLGEQLRIVALRQVLRAAIDRN